MGNHTKAPEKKSGLIMALFGRILDKGKHIIIVTSAGLPAIFVYEFLLSPHRAENVHFIL